MAEDHLGFTTIGIGRMIGPRKGGGISAEEADYLLENGIGRVITGIRAKLKWFDRLSDTRQRALVNMAFQLGVNGLLNFKKMLRAMKSGDFERATVEALDSNWYRQAPGRATRIADMIREG